jgi:hypothetical protein
MRLYSTRTPQQVIDANRQMKIDVLLTQLNNLYLSDKINAVDYTKLEKLIFSNDQENMKMVAAILNVKS